MTQHFANFTSFFQKHFGLGSNSGYLIIFSWVIRALIWDGGDPGSTPTSLSDGYKGFEQRSPIPQGMALFPELWDNWGRGSSPPSVSSVEAALVWINNYRDHWSRGNWHLGHPSGCPTYQTTESFPLFPGPSDSLITSTKWNSVNKRDWGHLTSDNHIAQWSEHAPERWGTPVPILSAPMGELNLALPHECANY